MISEDQIILVKKLLNECTNPVFVFDDDPDGLCSFLLLYRMLEKGHGIIVKNSPTVTYETYAEKVSRHDPDLIIILDKPMVEETFFENFNCSIIWIDHHTRQNPPKKVLYCNPLQNSKQSTPTTYQVWQIVKNERVKDSWLALTGCIGDWYFPSELAKITEENYPGLVEIGVSSAPVALFGGSRVGMLVKLLYFNLKGKVSDSEKNFKVLTRIEGPFEILDQTSAKGKFLWKNYVKINEEYERLKKEALNCLNESPFLLAIMHQQKYSFSSELSNEIFFMHPEKIVVLGRSSSGYTKGSIRTSFDINMPPVIEHALVGLDGYGGGHPQACGFKVKDEDFELFLQRFKEGILELLKNV